MHVHTHMHKLGKGSSTAVWLLLCAVWVWFHDKPTSPWDKTWKLSKKSTVITFFLLCPHTSSSSFHLSALQHPVASHASHQCHPLSTSGYSAATLVTKVGEGRRWPNSWMFLTSWPLLKKKSPVWRHKIQKKNGAGDRWLSMLLFHLIETIATGFITVLIKKKHLADYRQVRTLLLKVFNQHKQKDVI